MYVKLWAGETCIPGAGLLRVEVQGAKVLVTPSEDYGPGWGRMHGAEAAKVWGLGRHS